MNIRKKLFNSNSGEIFVGVSIAVMQMAVCLTTIAGLIVSSTQKNAVNNSISTAQFAAFCQEFGEYSDQVAYSSYNLKVDIVNKNKWVINDVQSYYMLANGFDDIKYIENNRDMKILPGYVLPEAIQYALYGKENKDVVAYVINDKNINMYEDGIKFHGDSNGEEHHLITSDGRVFTIPGYVRTVDNEETRYYINTNSYYIISNDSTDKKAVKKAITAKDFDEIYGEYYDGTTVNKSSIYKEGLIVSSTQSNNSTNNIVSKAQLAVFSQEFSDYSQQVIIEANEIQANNVNNGNYITKTQAFYMVANGFELKDDHESITDFPKGYVIQDELYDALYPNKEETQGVIAYLIDDKYIENYEKSNFKFYGDSNGKEYHLITNYGDVFTIPGYPQKQEDGSVRYYINANGSYYTVSKDSKKDNTLIAPISLENLWKEI